MRWMCKFAMCVGGAMGMAALQADGQSPVNASSSLLPPQCGADYYSYMNFPGRAKPYRQPISPFQLTLQLSAIGACVYNLGPCRVPLMTEPLPGGETLGEALVGALNIEFLVRNLNNPQLKVTVLRNEMIGDPAQYREQELLFEDPYVGAFKGILLTPVTGSGWPGVVALHGHSDTAEIYRDNYSGPEYPKNGIALLIITLRVMDPWATCLDHGLIRIMEHHVTETLLHNGFNLIGLRAYEALLALRYLADYPGVAPGRIGLIGHSGGSSTGNLVARIAPDRVSAYVSDHRINYYMLPSLFLYLEPYHCETVPRVYPYHMLVNNFATLTMPWLGLPYDYDYKNQIAPILDFFKFNLK